MSDRAPYCRVYYSIVDDPKFANVYDDDRALAAWLRLLIVADMAWPQSAHMPSTTNRKAVAILVGAGLVDIQSGGRYRIHGLDAERNRRADSARAGSSSRWGANAMQTHSERNANGMQRHPDNGMPRARGHASVSPLVSDSVSDSEEGGPGETAPLFQAIAYIEERTRRSFGYTPGSKAWDTLSADIETLGWPKVHAAMLRVKEPFPDVAQLVFGASRLLHPIPKASPEDQAAERDQSHFDRGVAATQREIARLRGEPAR